MHFYQRVTILARAARDHHIASVPPAERPALKAIYEPFIASVLGHQRYWTIAFRDARAGGHKDPTSLREQHRVSLIQRFLEASEAKDWAKADLAREELSTFGFLAGRSKDEKLADPEMTQTL